MFSKDPGIDLRNNHTQSANSLSRGGALRRRYSRKNREPPSQPQPTMNDRPLRGRWFVTSRAVGANESECDEKTADAGGWEPNDSALGGFTEKVWMFSGFLIRVTEIIAGAIRSFRSEGATNS